MNLSTLFLLVQGILGIGILAYTYFVVSPHDSYGYLSVLLFGIGFIILGGAVLGSFLTAIVSNARISLIAPTLPLIGLLVAGTLLTINIIQGNRDTQTLKAEYVQNFMSEASDRSFVSEKLGVSFSYEDRDIHENFEPAGSGVLRHGTYTVQEYDNDLLVLLKRDTPQTVVGRVIQVPLAAYGGSIDMFVKKYFGAGCSATRLTAHPLKNLDASHTVFQVSSGSYANPEYLDGVDCLSHFLETNNLFTRIEDTSAYGDVTYSETGTRPFLAEVTSLLYLVLDPSKDYLYVILATEFDGPHGSVANAIESYEFGKRMYELNAAPSWVHSFTLKK
jgi:hypothetical protein